MLNGPLLKAPHELGDPARTDTLLREPGQTMGRESSSLPWAQELSATWHPRGPRPTLCSLPQPVVLRGEAPSAVPLIQHHQPPMHRLEQLQGLALGGLCRVDGGRREGHRSQMGATGRQHPLPPSPLPPAPTQQEDLAPHSSGLRALPTSASPGGCAQTCLCPPHPGKGQPMDLQVEEGALYCTNVGNMAAGRPNWN